MFFFNYSRDKFKNFNRTLMSMFMLGMISFLPVNPAAAAMITYSSVWTNPVGTVNLTGDGTDKLIWGIPCVNPSCEPVPGVDGSSWAAGSRSSPFDLGASLDGVEFQFSSLSHTNMPLTPGSFNFSGADLNVMLSVEGGVSETFTFFMDHFETTVGADDAILTPGLLGTIGIEGSDYDLSLLGFRDSIFTPPYSRATTGEWETEFYQIWARLDLIGEELPPPGGGGDDDIVKVPEPASIALMGLGLVGLGFARRKKAA